MAPAMAAPQSIIPPSTCITCLVVSPLFVTSASLVLMVVPASPSIEIDVFSWSSLSTSAVEPSVCSTSLSVAETSESLPDVE